MSDVGRELDTVVVSAGDDTGGRKVDQSGAGGGGVSDEDQRVVVRNEEGRAYPMGIPPSERLFKACSWALF